MRSGCLIAVYFVLFFGYATTISHASKTTDALKLSNDVLAMKVVDWPDGVYAEFSKSSHNGTPILRIQIDNSSKDTRTIIFAEISTLGNMQHCLRWLLKDQANTICTVMN